MARRAKLLVTGDALRRLDGGGPGEHTRLQLWTCRLSRDLPRRAILHCTPPARSGPRSTLAIQNSDMIFYRLLGSRIALADPSMAGCSAMAKAGICPLRQFGLAAREPRPRHSTCRPPKSFAAPISPAFAIPGRLSPTSRPVYLAIKGGNVFATLGAGAPPPEEILLHAQADAGTFVVDGARHRWVVDMGSDDYDLPGYFDHGTDGRSGRRWRYYRSQAAGHNTLTIGGQDQLPNSPATIIGSNVEGDNKWVVLDLSLAYGRPAGTIRRGAALLGRQIVIQDEIDPGICSEITWTAHTAAEPVALTGSFARFRVGDDQFDARILEPAGARFALSPPPPPRSFALGRSAAVAWAASRRQPAGVGASAAYGCRGSARRRTTDPAPADRPAGGHAAGDRPTAAGLRRRRVGVARITTRPLACTPAAAADRRAAPRLPGARISSRQCGAGLRTMK